MRVAFRTDASVDIGNGHVIRCLTLASELRRQKSNCFFICRLHDGNLIDKIRKHGFDVVALPASVSLDAAMSKYDPRIGADWETDAHQSLAAIGSEVDWIVVDHYALSDTWETLVRQKARRVLVIDDLADRCHDANLLLDQNAGRKTADYEHLVSGNCQILAGPTYALLRNEFIAQRKLSLQRRKTELRHLLVNMGGVDKDNTTSRVIEQLKLCNLPKDTKITVILGPHAPHVAAIRKVATSIPWPTQVLVDTDEIASLMTSCDLAIGAAGGSALERCCLGLPSIIIPIADNQLAGAQALSARGAAILASLDSRSMPQISDAMTELLENGKFHAVSLASASITDGGGAKTVARLMRAEENARIRLMQESDLDQVLAWRNDPQIRQWMINSDEISNKEHIDWFLRSSTNTDCELLIVESNGQSIGFVQFTGLKRRFNPEWGFYAAPDAPKGSGTLLCTLALDYAFRTLCLPRLIGRTVAMNLASIRVHKKLGFRQKDSDEVKSGIPTLRKFELLREEWEHAQGMFA